VLVILDTWLHSTLGGQFSCVIRKLGAGLQKGHPCLPNSLLSRFCVYYLLICHSFPLEQKLQKSSLLTAVLRTGSGTQGKLRNISLNVSTDELCWPEPSREHKLVKLWQNYRPSIHACVSPASLYVVLAV
jgi:hypothetical protein